MAQLLINPQNQFFDANGDPLAGGKLYSFDAGTTTPRDTYTDQGAGTPNANPVILDANGRCEVWLDATINYRFRLDDANDVTIWDVDNIEYLPDGFVTTAKLANSSVTAAKLGTSAVETAKINDLAVTTGKLAANAVTTAKITDLNVTTAKLAANAVTPAKQAARNYAISSSNSGAYSTTSTSPVDVTNLSVSITTNGRPVLLFLQAADIANSGYIQILDSTGSAAAFVRIFRDSTEIAQMDIGLNTSGGGSSETYFVPPGCVHFLDVPGAGTYTYKIETQVAATNDTIYFNYLELVAVEL